MSGGGSDDSTKWLDSRPLDSVNYAIHDAKLSSVTTVSRWASHETGIRCDGREQSDHYATDSALAPSLLRAASGSLGSWGRGSNGVFVDGHSCKIRKVGGATSKV